MTPNLIDMNPIKLKSLLAVSAAAFIIYPIYIYLTAGFLHYDGQWWFERINLDDPSSNILQLFFTIIHPTIFLHIIPGIVGIYGGYHFFKLRGQILDGTIKAVSKRIKMGILFVWTPWTVLGLFLLHPLVMGVVNNHDLPLLFIQNFIFFPLASLFTLNLSGMLSLYVYHLRKQYVQNHNPEQL